MKNFLMSDIVWESRKEILVSPHPRKTIPLVHSCQKDPEASALSLINQDLLYLKKGNSRPEKIVLSLHKFPVKEPRKPKEEVYSNSKIIQVVKTYWELGHEHKFITEIVTIRANKYLVSITEPDYKNLNKNDIEDIYLLIMNGKKVNLTAPTMTFLGIEDHEMFSIIYEPVHGIIYKNSKKEKRVMRHSEIHKFCDATLNRVLEGLKSYNNDIKYGYVQKDLTKDEVEYLKLFEEEIEERLKHQHAKFDESDTYVLERFDTSAGNPVKEILLKLYLPDHRSILTDSKENVKMVMERALSLDKLVMPPHLHKKFRMGVAIAKGCRGYYKPGTSAWVRRGSRKIRIPIDMYPCRVEERLTIKLVKGEEVLKIETTLTAKDGTITKFLGKIPEYKPTKEEEEISKLKAICENVIYDISNNDSDLESTTRSGPRDSEMEDARGSGIRINA
ncbi:hypothetical protein Tco_0854959 [Tanacetum coccineum]